MPHQLNFSKLVPPSPYDFHPDFPNLLFRFEDDSPRLGFPPEIVDPNIVAQIVPRSDNKYTVKFDGVTPVVWRGARDLFQMLREAERSAEGVVVHPRREGVKVVGVTRGYSRFVVGAGVSLYVKQVIGGVPDGVCFGTVVTEDMVAVRACTVPGIEGASLTYHILPAEYVSDPPIPEYIARGRSPLELELYLPPPPVFFQGSPFWEGVEYRYAKVQAGISFEEWLSGGRVDVNAGGIFFHGVAERGYPYLRLRGEA